MYWPVAAYTHIRVIVPAVATRNDMATAWTERFSIGATKPTAYGLPV